MIDFLLSLAAAIGLLYWAYYTFALLFVELVNENPQTWRRGLAVGYRTLPKAMVFGLAFVVLTWIIEPALTVGDKLREYHDMAKLAWGSHRP